MKKFFKFLRGKKNNTEINFLEIIVEVVVFVFLLLFLVFQSNAQSNIPRIKPANDRLSIKISYHAQNNTPDFTVNTI